MSIRKEITNAQLEDIFARLVDNLMIDQLLKGTGTGIVVESLPKQSQILVACCIIRALLSSGLFLALAMKNVPPAGPTKERAEQAIDTLISVLSSEVEAINEVWQGM